MPLTNLNGIIAKIKEVLLAVTGVGTKVYDYERWAADWSSFLALFKSDSLIKGFEITRNKTLEETQASRTNYRTHSIIIRMYYSLDDTAASEKAARDIEENIAEAFRNKNTLDGNCIECSPLQIDISENRMFGSVLCHYREMRLEVTEEIQYT